MGAIQDLVKICEQAVNWFEAAPIDKVENIEAELGEIFPIDELKEALVKAQEDIGEQTNE